MRCSLIDKDFNNPYTAVETVQGKPSYLYAQLYESLKKTEGNVVDKVAAEKAYKAYQITQTEEFQKWFVESPSGHNVNTQGEPKLLGNSYASGTLQKPEFWYMLDSNKNTATQSFPLGLKRIAGLAPKQILEAVDVLFAEIMKNETYTVQDFEDASKINFDVLVFFIGKENLKYNAELFRSMGYKKDSQPIGEGTKHLYAEMFRDLIAYDSITGNPILKDGRFLLNPKSKFLDLVIKRVVAGGKLKNEIEEDEKTGPLNITPAHFTNPKESASANTKLLIQSLYAAQWEEDPINPTLLQGATLGKPILVNSTKVYAKLQTYLSDIHPTAENPDVYSVMIDRIKTMTKYHAEFKELAEILENPATPEYKKTQFVQAFYRPSIDYSTTFIVGSSKYQTKIGSPDVQSSENDILDKWQLKFEDKLITTNRKNQKILRLDKAKAAYDAYDSFVYKFGKKVRAGEAISEGLKKEFLQVLSKLGIEFSPSALDFYLKTNAIKGDVTTSFTILIESLNYVFEKSKSPNSVTLKNLIVKAENAKDKNQNTPVLEDELGDVKSLITDEASVKALAVSEAVFKEDLIDNTVLGPGGDLYWKYGLYSFLHIAVQKLKAGDSTYIEDLANTPYGENSRWVKWLLDDTRDSEGTLNREKFTLEQFLHMVNESEASQGKKFNELLGPDEFINSVTRTLSGKFGAVARGSSQTEYTIQGPPVEDSGVEYMDGKIVFKNDNIVKIFKGYIQADLAAQAQAFKDIKNATKDPKKLDMSNMRLWYHYQLDKKTGKPVFFDDKGYPVGNVFKSDTMVFPELGYNPNEKGEPTGLAKEIGLYKTTKANRGNPYTYTENTPGESLDNPKIEKLIKDRFEIIFEHNLKKASKYKVFGEDPNTGEIYNRAIDYKLLTDLYEENVGDQKAARALGDYVLNSMIANQESIMLFTGQPAMYKSMEDMPKRTSHFTTPVAKLRIYKNSEGKWEVNPEYLHSTVEDVEVPSQVLDDPRFEQRVGKNIARLWKNVDIADGSTWVSPNLFRQRERGIGRWSDARNESFERIMNGTATKEDYKIAMFTPIKGTVRGMDVKGNLNVPRIEKTAYMPLWPALVNTGKLQTLYDDMLAAEKEHKELYGEEIGSQIAVLSSVKLGVNTVNKINEGAELSYVPGSLEFSRENHTLWGLAQDIPTKGFKPTVVGSQPKINIQANIDPAGRYGNLTGTEWLQEAHDVERAISNIGLEEFVEEFGIEVERDSTGKIIQGRIADKGKFHRSFIEKFLETDNMNMVEGLESGVIPLDAMFHARSKIQSIITNGLKNKTVLYKAMGGQFAQMTSFGTGLDENRYRNLKSSTKNKIKWLVPESRLKAPRLDKANKKVLPGQILLPYRFIKKIKGWENMTDEQLKAKIDPKALQIIGYRIPNQSIASMDSLEIVGILPEEMGDTVIVYEDITTKTGSDFDIDKVFFLLPNLRIDGPAYGNTGKLIRIPSNEGTKASLENRRIELWEDVLQSVDSIKQVMYPTDAEFLKDDANAVRKLIEANNPETDENGKDIMLGMKFISPDYQSSLRNRFITGQKMVAAVANNITDHVLSQQVEFSLNIDIGIGIVRDGKTYLNATNVNNNAEELLISQIFSAYMNANVDIEKDPYISYVNFNPNTSNVGFLLLRAGVDYKWVNRFLAQPILRELSETMYAVKSESMPIKDNRSAFNLALEEVRKEFFKDSSQEFEDVEGRIYETLDIVSRYTDADVKANPDTIYVFGDNNQRTGTGGQAQIRNNPNAFGISTKLKPKNTEDAFMSDNDLESNKAVIDNDIAKIQAQNKPLVFPQDGFGTGLARLQEKAPETYKYLKQRLLEEFGFNNDTGETEVNVDLLAATKAAKLKAEKRLEDRLSVNKLNDLLEKGEEMEDYWELQRYILEQFETLKETGDEVFGQLISTKVNTKGPGKSLIEALIARDKRVWAARSILFNNYELKFINTTLGAQYDNSVEFLLNTFSGEFLSASPFMQTGLHAILAASKNIGSVDVELHTRIVNKMYSYVYSSFFAEMPGYTEQMQNLLFNHGSSEAFVNRFREMQKANPNSILLELLGSKLNFNESEDFSKPSYIYSRGTKSVPSDVMNLAYREWEAMYLDKETQKFASDLVVVAFASSGFNNTLSSFHTMIPMRWLIDSGFADHMKRLSAELNPEHHESMGTASLYTEQMISQVMRHEFENKELVRDYTGRKGISNVFRKSVNGKPLKLPKSVAIEVKGNLKSNMTTYRSEEEGGPRDYIRYFRYDVTEDVKVSYINSKGKAAFKTVQKTTPMLYEFVGVDPNSKNPIYTSTDPLGFKGKEGIKLVEYEFNREYAENYRKPSIFAKNNSSVERGGKQFKSFLSTLIVPLRYEMLTHYTNPNLNC